MLAVAHTIFSCTLVQQNETEYWERLSESSDGLLVGVGELSGDVYGDVGLRGVYCVTDPVKYWLFWTVVHVGRSSTERMKLSARADSIEGRLGSRRRVASCCARQPHRQRFRSSGTTDSSGRCTSANELAACVHRKPKSL